MKQLLEKYYMKSRGVIYFVWNRPAIEKELQASILSVERIGLPYKVIEGDSSGDDWNKDTRQKAQIYELSPFDETLFLDTDTRILAGDLDFAFEKASSHGIAMTIDPASLASRSGNKAGVSKHAIEYNTGVMFFNKSDSVKNLFDEWKQYVHVTEADQCGFAKAMEMTNFNPFVLPNNWNFRAGQEHQCFGPVNIWHSRRPIPKNWDNSSLEFKFYKREYSLNALRRRFKRMLGKSRGMG